MSEIAASGQVEEISPAEGRLFIEAIDRFRPFFVRPSWLSRVIGGNDPVVGALSEAWFDVDGSDVCINRDGTGGGVTIFEEEPNPTDKNSLIVTERSFSVIEESASMQFLPAYEVITWNVNPETGDKQRIISEIEQMTRDALKGAEDSDE